jgi:hypothetical protein
MSTQQLPLADVKRHKCPICSGTGLITTTERSILLKSLELADWANYWRQYIERSLAIRPLQTWALLALGTVIGALAMWLLHR